jgi:hypothetical protein
MTLDWYVGMQNATAYPIKWKRGKDHITITSAAYSQWHKAGVGIVEVSMSTRQTYNKMIRGSCRK